MIQLQISDSVSAAGIPVLKDVQFLERAADEALRSAGAPGNSGLAIVIGDDAQLQELNRQYLGIDAPTDVLSFPSGETGPAPDSGEVYLGDILISYPRALAQAQAGGHAVQDELRLLVVHGVLHLLGYDHAEAEERAEMWALQSAILERLGSSLRSPAE